MGNVLAWPIPGRPPREKAALLIDVQALLEAHPEARKPRVLPVVGNGVWYAGQPHFYGPSDSRPWLDALPEEEFRGFRCSIGRVVGRVQGSQANLGAGRVGAARIKLANSAAALSTAPSLRTARSAFGQDTRGRLFFLC
jgi:hypothetical protein